MYSIDPPTSTGTLPRPRDRLDVCGGGQLVTRDGRCLSDVEDVELVMRDAVAFA